MLNNWYQSLSANKKAKWYLVRDGKDKGYGTVFTGSRTALTLTQQRKQQAQIASPSLSLVYLVGKHKMHRSFSKIISSSDLVSVGHQS